LVGGGLEFSVLSVGISTHFDALAGMLERRVWWEEERSESRHVPLKLNSGAKPGTFPKWNVPTLCSRTAHSLNVPPVRWMFRELECMYVPPIVYTHQS
jgi:hypothetical protein